MYGWYELLRLRQQAVNNTTVISPTIYNALTSANPTLPFTYTPVDANGNPDPAGAQTINLLNFTSNATPGNTGTNFQYTVDPTMLALIKQIPASLANNTRVGDGVNLLGYQLNAQANNTQDNFGFRVDYDLNQHNTITGTFAWNRQIVDRPDIDTSYDTVPLVTNNDKEKFLSLGMALESERHDYERGAIRLQPGASQFPDSAKIWGLLSGQHDAGIHGP